MGTAAQPVALALHRHQLRRDSGAPCVSVLVGDVAAGRAAFRAWASEEHRPCALVTADLVTDSLQPAAAGKLALFLESGDAEHAARLATHIATRAPHTPIAIAIDDATSARWTSATSTATWLDVARAGRVVLRGRRSPPTTTVQLARSALELLLYQLLVADPRTRGRFRHNQRMSFRFGRKAAEIDLWALADRVAVEVDGPHHFASLAAYRRDRRKDVLLQRHGFFVFRVAAPDVVGAGNIVVDAIADVLAHPRGARGP
jgi:very-short-patch-repair endonuclease